MVKFFEKEIENNRLTVRIFGIKLFSHKLKTKLKKNYVVLIKQNGERVYNPKIKGLTVQFRGNYNVVKLYEPFNYIGRLSIGLNSRNKVTIKSSKYDIQKLHIEALGHSEVFIDEDFAVGDGIFIADYNSKIKIGKGAMFSYSTVMQTGDQHLIYNKDTEQFNGTKDIIVGNHVWVGYRAIILKKSVIPDGSIVGMGSIVTKKFDKENSVIVGSPAQLVKSNIRWDRTHYWEMMAQKRENEFAQIFSKQ